MLNSHIDIIPILLIDNIIHIPHKPAIKKLKIASYLKLDNIIVNDLTINENNSIKK